MEKISPQDLFTVRQAAVVYGVTQQAVEKKINDKSIPPEAVIWDGKRRFLNMVIVRPILDAVINGPDRAVKNAMRDAKKRANDQKNAQKKEDDKPRLLTDAEKLVRAKQETEVLRARKEKIKLDEMEGKLLDAEVVKREIKKIVLETREKILSVPDQIGPDLLACDNLVLLQTKLTGALNIALRNLARLEKDGK